MKYIGITCGFLYPDKTRASYSAKTLSYVENETVNYIAKAGCFPVVIPDLEDKHLYRVLDRLDSLILHGGSDVAPETYGEKPIGGWHGDKYRDDYELKIIDYCFNKSKPIMGICRGCQILNVYFGGTLYQDIATQLKTSVIHSDHDKYDLNYHEIDFTGDNFLKDILKSDGKQYVNSIHHQAVKELGKDLSPLCVSPSDGIIEAYYYTGKKKGFYLGIQWHPEFNHNLDVNLLSAEELMKYFLGKTGE
jgi:putative glutamine amidotransferase